MLNGEMYIRLDAIAGSKDHSQELRELARWACDSIDCLIAEGGKLQDVVDRLPVTADGVPVCPGDTGLYAPDADGEIVEHCTAPAYMMTEGGEYEAWYIEERGGELHDRLRPIHDVYPSEVFYGRVEMFYSTPEAAEAAQKENEDE